MYGRVYRFHVVRDCLLISVIEMFIIVSVKIMISLHDNTVEVIKFMRQCFEAHRQIAG